MIKLGDIFAAVAHKKLVTVDLPHRGSNQHELNGVVALKELFRTSAKQSGRIAWRYFADDQEALRDENEFTFYDARAKSAARTGRSEWRFYYPGNFLANADVGDLLVLARTTTGSFYGLVFQKKSSWARAAEHLFLLPDLQTTFGTIPTLQLENKDLEFLGQQILAELDLDIALPAVPTDEELILQKFGRSFPTTKEMSAFARSVTDVDFQKADETLISWLEREEQLFRALESVIIRERLIKNFQTVDEFIEYSLSVQNRRKSRMGHALQNHLAELFKLHGLRFTAQAKTEGTNRPDFIFPGEREYHNPSFDSSLLIMLGVKSTSKDRWRQVLTEADRISRKHLCTLEAGISTQQTDEMNRQRLTLVVPNTLHTTYTSAQRKLVLTLGQFISEAELKQ